MNQEITKQIQQCSYNILYLSQERYNYTLKYEKHRAKINSEIKELKNRPEKDKRYVEILIKEAREIKRHIKTLQNIKTELTNLHTIDQIKQVEELQKRLEIP